MNKVRITKEFNFEMAHALYGYDGPCKNIHGHSYSLSVTVLGSPINDSSNPKNGMVMDFSDLKKIVKGNIIDRFDHALVLNQNSPHHEFSGKELFENIVFMPFQPTCENMLLYFVEQVKKELQEPLQLFSMRLRETKSSYAEWHAAENDR